MPNVWWVNQRAAKMLEEFEVVWAPMVDRTGRHHSHWDLMDEVVKGELILHYSQQKVVAISTADGPAYSAPRPWDDYDIADKWIQEGRRISVDVAPLDASLAIKSLDLEQLAPYTGPGP